MKSRYHLSDEYLECSDLCFLWKWSLGETFYQLKWYQTAVMRRFSDLVVHTLMDFFPFWSIVLDRNVTVIKKYECFVHVACWQSFHKTNHHEVVYNAHLPELNNFFSRSAGNIWAMDVLDLNTRLCLWRKVRTHLSLASRWEHCFFLFSPGFT